MSRATCSNDSLDCVHIDSCSPTPWLYLMGSEGETSGASDGSHVDAAMVNSEILRVDFVVNEYDYDIHFYVMSPLDAAAISAGAAHDGVTLALAKKESAEHLVGMDLVFNAFRSKPLIVKAYPLGHTHALLPDLASEEQTKTIHFVRHGQGFHNFLADKAVASGVQWTQFVRTPENPYTALELTDAPLTEKGRQQALELRRNGVKALLVQPQLVVLSPASRALQTGILAFGDSIGKVPFVAHEMVREQTGVHLCDKRRPREDLQHIEFPQVDFSLLESNEDNIFQADHRESNMQVAERIYKFLEWLESREEEHVAVISHSGWLLTLLNGVVEVDSDHAQLKAWFQTGEMRSCKFVFSRTS